MALVQSVDHFRAFIGGPFVFERHRCRHALSDIHAMGARQRTTHSDRLALPFMHRRAMRRKEITPP
jgi:hypothetical protein